MFYSPGDEMEGSSGEYDDDDCDDELIPGRVKWERFHDLLSRCPNLEVSLFFSTQPLARQTFSPRASVSPSTIMTSTTNAEATRTRILRQSSPGSWATGTICPR